MSPVGKTAGSSKCKKPGQTWQPSVVKYGVEIPQNVAHVYELDALHGNTLWQDAIKKEISSLLELLSNFMPLITSPDWTSNLLP